MNPALLQLIMDIFLYCQVLHLPLDSTLVTQFKLLIAIISLRLFLYFCRYLRSVVLNTNPTGELDCPLQRHVMFPPKGNMTNHVHYVTAGRLKAASLVLVFRTFLPTGHINIV